MDACVWWMLVGVAGQVLFSLRFVVQWIASERERRSVLPVSFWYFSLAGAVILLAYAVHRRDPVFVGGQLLGVLVYCRNLHLVRLSRSAAQGP